jgi:STE24 endopeptidase
MKYLAPFYLITSIIIFNFILERVLDYLNSKYWSPDLPKELSDVYDPHQYKKSQLYKKANDKFTLFTNSFSFIIVISMLVLGGFGYIDHIARKFSDNPIVVALIFFGILLLASDLINTPFSIYDTFVIEERFGFNKTNVVTYILDKLKGWLLTAIIGGGIIALIVWFSEITEYFWLFAWIAISAFMIFMNMFNSTLIVPLFNKQTPLEEGELKDAIEDFCRKVNFKLDNVFVIDGSKRSTKANAYFAGLGSKKRIVLYDTLINDLSKEEIVAVLAHEIGHYKKKHVIHSIITSIIQTGITLYIFSLFTVNYLLSRALGAEVNSIHMVLIAFGVIYSPISTIVGLFMNIISRRNEYAADRFVKDKLNPKYLISALKKLSSNTLSNLVPHPAYVFFHYSHPTLLQRIRALNT